MRIMTVAIVFLFSALYMDITHLKLFDKYSSPLWVQQFDTPLSLKLAPSGLEWFNIFLSSLVQKNVVLLLQLINLLLHQRCKNFYSQCLKLN